MKIFNKKFQDEDFNEKDLPSTRKQQFFDFLKHRKTLLFKFSLILLLFLLPFVGSVIAKDSMMASVDLNLETNVLKKELIKISSIYVFFVSISLLIFFLGLSGLMKIIKRLLWREPIFLKDDFFSGIKENGFYFVIYGFILSLLFAISQLFPYLTNGILQYLPTVLNLAFFYPVILTILFLVCFYKNRFFSNIKLGIEFYIKNPLFVFLFIIFVFGMFQIKYIEYIYIKYLIIGIFIIIFLPLFILIMFEYYTFKFDELINKERFPNFYKKGIK